MSFQSILRAREGIFTDLDFFWHWQVAVGTWCGGPEGVVLWCHTCNGVMGCPFGGIDDSKVLDLCLCLC